ncbi:MAG: SDR family NAD(P)-dependent oxidoreductase [Halieaceae bacterium]|nr:SDR family NAD(P)-dependent oxidoreductase [Halieaceae bacterium]
MPELGFDKRVAVVTGAGRGLGRAYALLLAARGANVVVNDPGVSMTGETTDACPAEEVVQEIKAAGGEAVANFDSVASREGGQAIVNCALDHFGAVDIVIHNAGIVRRSPLKDISYEEFRSVLDVHLMGGFHVVRPAFAEMCKANYGRIVLTGSISGLYGNSEVVGYSVSKTGMIGLSNVVALEGAEYNIKCNVILPAALTRMAEGLDTSAYPPMQPELVAPTVGWLAHESCSISGEMLVSIAGRVARAYIAESRGIYQPSWTIENIAEHIDAIRSTDDPVIFKPAPSGQLDHILYSFGMASKD